MSEIPQQHPFEDQRKQAIQLYENMAKECHHWSSFIQRAIESYNPDIQAKLSFKEQELKDSVLLYQNVVNTLQAKQQECEELKTVNAQLRHQVIQDSKEINSLRKRCEDLEADNKRIIQDLRDADRPGY